LIEFSDVGAILVQGVTAYILLEEAKITEGDAVRVSAAGGGLGSFAVQLAKAQGATVVGISLRVDCALWSSSSGLWPLIKSDSGIPALDPQQRQGIDSAS